MAVSLPITGGSSIFSTSSRRAPRLPTSVAMTEAISGPILGRPSAAMKVLSVMLLLPSSWSITLLADFSAILSSPSMSSRFSLYRSARFDTSPVSHICSASFSPIPSISRYLHQ